MKSSNDHELAIVSAAGQISVERSLNLSAVQEIVSLLDFQLTGSGCQFLVHYIQWRMANPIVK